MTTTDMPATPTPEPPTARRLLRRSRDSRVAAGVSGGLGDYFGVDPVLFRVLFATSAFFGGAGILAYLVAWAAIPEQGTERAPIDGMIGELRRRQIPPWVVAVGIGVLVWAVAFSWWSPGPLLPIVAVVVLLAVAFGRRELQGQRPPAPVDLTKHGDATAASPAPWVGEIRSWWDESREASRRRARRALPVKIAALGGLAATLVVLAIVDAADGVALPVYFWVALGFVAAGLLVGAALRRTPWSIATLLLPIAIGLVAFAGSHARLHDGVGDRTWTPPVRPAAEYRLAFGQGVLDLRTLPTQTVSRTVRVTAAAGQIRILVRKDANVAVDAHVHIGRIDVRDTNTSEDAGVGLFREIPAPATASGARTTVVVRLADGQVAVVRR